MYSIPAFLLPLRERFLIGQFARRELAGRYRGSVLGFAWALFNPLLMLAVYSFAFTVVFRARWPGLEDAGGLGYTLNLFCGLVVFNLFAEVMTRAPTQISERANLVKKVIFPLHTLAWSTLIAGLVQFAVSLGVLLVAVQIWNPSGLHLSALSLPILLVVFAPFLLGLSWLLSSLGVFIRDLSQLMQVIVTLSLFLSPVFYPASLLPESLRIIFWLNPLTPIVEQVRSVLIDGLWPDPLTLAVYAAFSVSVAVGGAWWFRRTQTAFADVL